LIEVLFYEMEQGKTEAAIIELARKTGMPLPDKIANKPQLIGGLELYWKAFVELSSDRAISMAEGPIPWSSMNSWALRHGIYGNDFDRFVAVVRGVDEAYLQKRGKSKKKTLGKGKGSFKKPGMRST